MVSSHSYRHGSCFIDKPWLVGLKSGFKFILYYYTWSFVLWLFLWYFLFCYLILRFSCLIYCYSYCTHFILTCTALLNITIKMSRIITIACNNMLKLCTICMYVWFHDRKFILFHNISNICMFLYINIIHKCTYVHIVYSMIALVTKITASNKHK